MNPLQQSDGEDGDDISAPERTKAILSHEDDQDEVLEPAEDDLFSKLAAAPSSVAGLVTEWLALVQVNGPAAVADVLSLVVRLARPIGCPPLAAITPQMVVANDPSSSVLRISHLLREDVPGPVPTAGKDSVSKKLRRAYEDFWRRLTAESSKVVLFDTDCFDTLISWLDAMTTAKSRALRMAACLAAFRLVDGLIDFGGRLRKELSSMQRQLATEKRRCGMAPKQPRAAGRKKRSKKGVDLPIALSKKGKDLTRKVDEMTAHNSELIALSSKVFDSILVLKYRDVSAEIRQISVTALGCWILSCPDHFLDDKHTKYIGWLLSDKEPVVRRSTLEVLSRMLRKKDFYSSLEMFLQRFCDRITEMARDKDDTVAVAAIRLLTTLSGFDIFDENVKVSICHIALKESQTDVRRAAGEFLSRMITSTTSEKSSRKCADSTRRDLLKKKLKPASGDVQNPALLEIPALDRSMDDIQQLMAKCSGVVRDIRAVDQVVDAVWDHLPALRCWEAYMKLFKTDRNMTGERILSTTTPHAKGKEGSSGGEDHALTCEILLASAREASGHGDPQRSSVVQRGERDSIETPCTKFSAEFLPELSHLLVQFQADVRALCALVQLPMFFEMQYLEKEGIEVHLNDILSRLVDLISRHTGSLRLVKICAETLKFLSSDGSPCKNLAQTTLQRACSAASKDLSIHVRADISAAEPLSISAGLLRVRVMSELAEPNVSVYSSAVKVLQYQIQNSSTSKLTSDITTDAVRTGCAVIAWCLAKIRARLESDKSDHADYGLVDDAVKDARDRGAELIDILAQICHSNSFSISCRMLCLQGLLTALTLCAGVESFYKSKGFSRPDFLGAREVSRDIADAVKVCTLAIIEFELAAVDSNLMRDSHDGSKAHGHQPEMEVRDCFASLVQASLQSALSAKIAHLPMLGLLVRAKKHLSSDPIPYEWSCIQLCKRYCQQRQVKKTIRIEQERMALREVADIKTEHLFQPVRRLTDNILALREPGTGKEAAARDLLECLIGSVVACYGKAEDVCKEVRVLTEAGFAILPHLTVNDARVLLPMLQPITDTILSDYVRDAGEMVAILSNFISCLKSRAANEVPDIPKLHKPLSRDTNIRRKQSSRRRKRTAVDGAAYHSSSHVDLSNVRRSKRSMKRLDYARLSGLEGEEDLADDSASDQMESDGEGSQISRENVVELQKALARGGNDIQLSPHSTSVKSKSNQQKAKQLPFEESSSTEQRGGVVPSDETWSCVPHSSQVHAASHAKQAKASKAKHCKQPVASPLKQRRHSSPRQAKESPGIPLEADIVVNGSKDTAEAPKCRTPSVADSKSDAGAESHRTIERVSECMSAHESERRSEAFQNAEEDNQRTSGDASTEKEKSSSSNVTKQISAARQDSSTRMRRSSARTRSKIDAQVSTKQVAKLKPPKRGLQQECSSEDKENIEDTRTLAGTAKNSSPRQPVVRRTKRRKRW
ncbi:unnamed protein product [Chondrus crispus]|uniref:SCD domain-containing protein n=1 Tax=Chondrus crispus TaxID=2769 RepID=R7QBF1_CHOCR|nr:unnamed protein product [Chondrus crispus]CDF35389.1 unnamed protein product [Chondrus crispus]|eukprot:XP_005715208.1 unnamed protein product [Chondrus crispus]